MFEIGNTLREARVRRDLDIAECEVQTKIRGKYLRAMEAEDFDILPARTYVRGFLKSYSEFLGLDGNLILDEYESRFVHRDLRAEPDPRRRRGQAPGRSGTGPRRDREGRVLAAAVAGVLSVSAIVWTGVSGGRGPAERATLPSAGRGAQVTPPGVPATPPVRPRQIRVVLTGLDPEGSYLQVRGRNRSGPAVFDGVLLPGARRAWNVRRGLWMSVGRPTGVRVEVDGVDRPLDATADSFQVTREGVTVAPGTRSP